MGIDAFKRYLYLDEVMPAGGFKANGKGCGNIVFVGGNGLWKGDKGWDTVWLLWDHNTDYGEH
jgi:hypothetical protein